MNKTKRKISESPHFLLAAALAINPHQGLWKWHPDKEQEVVTEGGWKPAEQLSMDPNDVYCLTPRPGLRPMELPPFLALVRQAVARREAATQE